ncbi:MAG: polysaccharide deacetylase family protein [Proteobacteria bacterium]|nr:polysaccharide deacetylase family protein [Pseudomonadota bacterium]
MSLWWLSVLLIPVLLVSARYCWWKPALPDALPRVLMYHMVSTQGDAKKHRGLRVNPKLFERQVAWLAANGWTFVTMSELAARDYAGDKLVALTFDDGYEDNLTNALPVLQKYAAKATLYLVVERHDNDWSVKKKAHHNSGALAAEPKLSDDQVHALLASGVFELGGHTLTHCHLPSTAFDDKVEEISACRMVLEHRFNTPVTSFAYPFGIFADEDVALVREAGFSNAVTTHEGIDGAYEGAVEGAFDNAGSGLTDPFRLRRVKISGKDNFWAFKIRMRIGFRGYL